MLLDREFAEEFALFPARGIMLPCTEQVGLSSRLASVLDLPIVQRLRSVRQLSLTHLVYPGATHSRFEHSLGVYARTRQFLRAVLQPDHNGADLNAPEVASALLASILHDVGHYPFAHAFEEVDYSERAKFNHEHLLVAILDGKIEAPAFSTSLKSLAQLLEDDWGVSLNDIKAVLTGRRPAKPSVQSELRDQSLVLLHSFLNGQVDADKLDYLVRDSHHCGINGGSVVDVAGVLEGLRVVRSGSVGQTLGVVESKLSAIETVLSARLQMYTKIYWHRRNRAMERMVTEAMWCLWRSGSIGDKEFHSYAYQADDDGMLRWLSRRLVLAKFKGAASLLISPLLLGSGNRTGIFKRLLTVAVGVHAENADRDAEEHAHITQWFSSHLSADTLKYKYPLFELRVRCGILEKLPRSISAVEVLLDVPDRRVNDPARGGTRVPLEVLNSSGTTVPRAHDAELHAFLDANWRRNANRIRLICSPGARAALGDRGKSRAREIITEAVQDIAKMGEGDVATAQAEMFDLVDKLVSRTA